MFFKCLSVGPIGTNCYLLGGEKCDECAVIDPGAEPERILAAAEGRRIAAILLTHGHFDHIGGVEALRKVCPRQMIHPLDAPMLADPGLNGGMFLMSRKVTAPPATDFLWDGEEMDLAGLHFRVIHTPGHTPGGVCYQTEDCLFTGDTVFHHGWGRTDLPGGNQEQLFASLRMLMPLIRTLRIFPGHED